MQSFTQIIKKQLYTFKVDYLQLLNSAFSSSFIGFRRFLVLPCGSAFGENVHMCLAGVKAVFCCFSGFKTSKNLNDVLLMKVVDLLITTV